MTYPTPQTFIYKTDASGHQIHCDVYVPDPPTPKPCPVIMWMHYSGLVFENRYAVGTHMFYSAPKRGYILVNLDYRLAPQVKMEEIYADVEDCARWVRSTLPDLLLKDPGVVVDPERLVIGGGSCGGQLALTTGLYLNPPPQAIVSLYAISDPTDPIYSTATSPTPPPGRDALIPYAEVCDYLNPDAPSESHPENGLDIPNTRYENRATAFFYMLQEGIYLPCVYGETSREEIYAKWAIREHNVTHGFPPTFVAHAAGDRFVPVAQSEELVRVLQSAGVAHCWYNVPGNRDHGFDVWDMSAGEVGELDKEFAGRLWPWLDEVVKS